MPTIFATVPAADATDLVETLLEERLAACVNQVPCRSTYRWEGDVHRDEEVILLAKTTDDAADALEARLEELHPYEVPCIERFDEVDALEAFVTWREAVTDRRA